jgi:hypothetical protein
MLDRVQSSLIAGGAAAMVSAWLLTLSAQAQEELNCGAYASAAVAQQQHNVQQGCGFTGPAWSADFNAHFAWCQSGAQMADLTREDRARSDLLAQCTAQQAQQEAQEAAEQAQQQAQQEQKIADCQEYARKAVEHQSANQYLKCGFSGGAWSANHAAHFDWCMGAPQAAVNQEDSTRYSQLQGCISVLEQQKAAQQAKLQSDCQYYADVAVCMRSRANQLDCSVSGSRWGTNRQTHYDWCLGATPAARQAEANARDARIEQCRKPDFLGKLFGSGKAFIAACP